MNDGDKEYLGVCFVIAVFAIMITYVWTHI